MIYGVLIITLLISSSVVLVFLPKVMLLSLKNKMLDKIDYRKVHTTTASRLGGASFLPAINIAVIMGSMTLSYLQIPGVSGVLTNDALMICCATMILYFIGMYDDIVGLRYKEKFVYQYFTAAMVIYTGNYITNFNGIFGLDEIHLLIGIPLSLVLIVFITNAVNLIDGIDGLASMLSMMALFMYGVMFFLNEDYIDCIICVATLGALGPFWHHNVFGIRRRIHSKIFMGDGGALVIGFILAVMAIKLWNSEGLEGSRFGYISNYSWVVAYTMLIIPCFDVLRVMLHRIREHKSPFLPDKNHFHHKLMAIGFSPRKSLVVLCGINLIFLSINLLLAYMRFDLSAVAVVDVALWLFIHSTLTNKIRAIQS